MLGPEYFLHAANVLRVISFSAKDIMWLRLFAILASIISIPYFYLQAAVLWEPIFWIMVFTIINGYHIWRLWLERRPISLSPDEAKLYELTFFPLSPRQFLHLVRLGQWVDLRPGDVLIRPNEPINEITVPLTESIDARTGGRSLGRFAAGAIIGASALFDARLKQLEAVAGESCRVLRLPIAVVKDRAKSDNQVGRTFDRIVREDLARKLEQLIDERSRSTD
jgi:Popeye protein conserved region